MCLLYYVQALFVLLPAMLQNCAILTRFQFQFRFQLLTFLVWFRLRFRFWLLHNQKKILKVKFLSVKFLSVKFLLKLDGNRLILIWNCVICSPTLIPFKTNVSNPYLRPFYTQNRNRTQNRTKSKIMIVVLNMAK